MQPSELSLKSFGFLEVFLDLPLSLSLESVFLVANGSSVQFIISQVLHMSWHLAGGTPVCASVSPGVLVEFEAPPFISVLDTPEPMLLSIRGNGVDSLFLRCGSTKSTLVPDCLSITNFSWAIECSQECIQFGLYGTRTFCLVLAHCVHSDL